MIPVEVEEKQTSAKIISPAKNHSRINEIAAVILLALAVLVFLCLITYSPTDWSLNTSNTQKTQNWIGVVGAVAADLMFQAIGLSAYIFPALLGLIAWRVFHTESLIPRISRVFGFLFFVVSTSGLVSLLEWRGGLIGGAFSNILIYLLTPFGAGILLFTFLIASILLLTNFSFFGLFDKLEMPLANLRIRINERLAKWRASREEKQAAELERLETLQKIHGEKSGKSVSIISLGEKNRSELNDLSEANGENNFLESHFHLTAEGEKDPNTPVPESVDTDALLRKLEQQEIKEQQRILEQQKQEEQQKIEEKQKFLEFRPKVNKLKNLVLEKVENLQSPSILSIDIDNMDGLDFEHYVADLLNKQGFETEVTKGSGDLGVDVIATNYDGKYAVQVKRYNQPVSRRAISDAVAGKSYYKCDLAMVITNNYFTKDAIKLAKSSGCSLVDRDKLIQWIKDYTNESKSYKQLLIEEIEELQHSNYYWGEDVVFEASKELIQEFNLDMGKQYEKYYIQEKGDVNKIYSYQNKSQSKSDCYVLPPTDFLAPNRRRIEQKDEQLLAMAQEIMEALTDLGVTGLVKHICQGPVFTTYEFKPDSNITSANLLALTNKLRTVLKIEKLRISRIPVKDMLGVEILNKTPETVGLREVVESKNFVKSTSPLTIALGKTAGGLNYILELSKLGHLFIAGATNRGKTAGLDVLINSIFYKANPNEVKFAMVDFTYQELDFYVDIPHLLTPVVTDYSKAVTALKWVLNETLERRKKFDKWEVRNIGNYNTEVDRLNFNEYFDDDGNPWKTLPYIIVIINEFPSITSDEEVENLITDISLLSHHVGIHLVLSTKKSSQEIGNIINKNGMFSKLISHIPAPFDSRFLVDQNMSSSLIDRNDMILLLRESKNHVHISEAFIDEKEIKKITEHIKAQSSPEYELAIIKANENLSKLEEELDDSAELPGKKDPLFWDAVKSVISAKRASTSLLQRHLRIGYGRAAAILDAMVREGYIGEMDGI